MVNIGSRAEVSPSGVPAVGDVQGARPRRDEGHGPAARRPDGPPPVDRFELSEDAKAEVDKLKRRDEEVRAHELAHLAAAGPYSTGAPSFTFRLGPDGHSYAVGGEVPIDLTEVAGDPEATVRKMQQIRRAALAPRDPSAQDRQVAAEASRIEAKARQDSLEAKGKQAALAGREAPGGVEAGRATGPGHEARGSCPRCAVERYGAWAAPVVAPGARP